MSSAGISFGGLASGLDTNAIISALVSIEQRPIAQLEVKKSSYTRQKSLFGDLDGLLDTLNTAVKALKTSSSFLSMKATSDDEDVLVATASSSATPGTYDIEVLQLARAQVNHTSGSASSTSTFGSYGEFTLNVDGNAHIVTVSNPTLENIRDAINALDANVAADVVDTGAATDPYQLVVRSTETGTDGSFTITDLDGDASFQTLINDLTAPANQQDAQNAQIKMNSVTITRSSNSMTGVLQGVTLDLKSANTPDTVTVTVSTDATETSSKVTEFVNAYNAIVDFMETQNALTDEGEAKSALFGDSTLRSIRSNLRNIIGSAVTTTGNEAYQMLSQIGIASDTNGKLTFTSSTLEEALATDEEAVANIFTDTTNGLAKRLEDQIKVYTDSVDGLIKSRQDSYDRLVKQTNDRIDQAERRLEQYEQRLQTKYANLESLLSQLQSQGSSLGSIFQPS